LETRQLRLYPSRKEKGTSFKGVEIITIPSQSLTLRDIIKRFIRKESLPIQREGFYSEDLGDIEKMERLDMTERHEMAADLKQKLNRLEKRFEQKAAKEAAEKAAQPQQPPLPNLTVTT